MAFLLKIFLFVMMLMFMLKVVFVVPFVLFLFKFMFFTFFMGFSFFFGFSNIELSGLLHERFRNVADSCPVFCVLFLLSSHFDEESSVADLFVEAVSNEMDGIDPGFEDNFEGARIVFFDFDEFEVGESFFNILLDGIEIAFHQV